MGRRAPLLRPLLAVLLAAMPGCTENPCLEAGGSCQPLTGSACLGGVPSSLSCQVDSSAELCCLPRVAPTEAGLECH